MKGHAGAAPRGEDLVCAGISSICQTALLGLLNYLNLKIDYKIASGYLHFKVPDFKDDEIRVGSKAILETMFLGLKNVEEFNQKHLSINEKEVL